MMVTATKVKAIHIPYPTLLLPLLIHTQAHGHLPSILPYPCGGCLPLSPTAPPQWRDALQQRPREGPCTQTPTPHRQTRLDSPPPPHTHTDYTTGGYR